MYEPLFGFRDRTNEAAGLPLGASIDLAQDRFRLALLAAMNATNILCLGDKSQVRPFISDVFFTQVLWSFQGNDFRTPPFQLEYCLDVRIDAAPLPVLAPGQPNTMLVDIRMRFIDGVELPGPAVAVAISATNATVTPAGGVLPTPVVAPVTIVPAGTTSIVTITAGTDRDFTIVLQRQLPAGPHAHVPGGPERHDRPRGHEFGHGRARHCPPSNSSWAADL